MFLVTTLPAPTTEPAPIVIPGMTTTLPPIQTSSSMRTGSEYWLPSARSVGSIGCPAVVMVTFGHVGVVDDHEIEVRVEALADVDVGPVGRQKRWLDPDRLAHCPQQLPEQSQSLFVLSRPGVVEVVEQFLAVRALGFERLKALALIDIEPAVVHPRSGGVGPAGHLAANAVVSHHPHLRECVARVASRRTTRQIRTWRPWDRYGRVNYPWRSLPCMYVWSGSAM
jgi:hypothetical protein